MATTDDSHLVGPSARRDGPRSPQIVHEVTKTVYELERSGIYRQSLASTAVTADYGETPRSLFQLSNRPSSDYPLTPPYEPPGENSEEVFLLKEQIRHMLHERDATEHKLEAYQAQLQNVKDVAERVRATNAAASRILDRNSELEMQVAELKKESRMKRVQLEKDVEILRTEKITIKDELDRLRLQVSSRELTENSLRQRLAESSHLSPRMRPPDTELQEKIFRLELSKADLQRQLEESEASFQSVTRRTETVSGLLDRIRTMEIASQRQAEDRMEEVERTAREEADRQRSQAPDHETLLREEYKKLEKDNSELQEELQYVTDVLQEMEKENHHLSHTTQVAEEMKMQKDSEMQSLKSHISELESLLKARRDGDISADELYIRNAELEQKLLARDKTHQGNLQAKDVEFFRMREQHSLREQEIVKLRATVEKYEKEAERTRDKRDSALAELQKEFVLQLQKEKHQLKGEYEKRLQLANVEIQSLRSEVKETSINFENDTMKLLGLQKDKQTYEKLESEFHAKAEAVEKNYHQKLQILEGKLKDEMKLASDARQQQSQALALKYENLQMEADRRHHQVITELQERQREAIARLEEETGTHIEELQEEIVDMRTYYDSLTEQKNKEIIEMRKQFEADAVRLNKEKEQLIQRIEDIKADSAAVKREREAERQRYLVDLRKQTESVLDREKQVKMEHEKAIRDITYKHDNEIKLMLEEKERALSTVRLKEEVAQQKLNSTLSEAARIEAEMNRLREQLASMESTAASPLKIAAEFEQEMKVDLNRRLREVQDRFQRIVKEAAAERAANSSRLKDMIERNFREMNEDLAEINRHSQDRRDEFLRKMEAWAGEAPREQGKEEELQKLVERLQEQKEEDRIIQEKLLAQIASLRESADERERSVQQFEEATRQLTVVRSEIREMEMALQEANKKMKGVELSRDAEASQLRQKLLDKEHEMKRLQADLQSQIAAQKLKVQQQCKLLESNQPMEEVQELRAQVNILTNEKRTLTTQLSSMMATIEERIKTREEGLRHAAECNSDLEQKLARKEQLIMDLRMAKTELEVRLSSLEGTQNQLEESRQRIASLETRLNEHRRQLSEIPLSGPVAEKLAECEHRLNHAKEDYEKHRKRLESDMNQELEENAKLIQNVHSQAEHISSLDDEMKGLLERNAKLESELMTLQNRFSDIQPSTVSTEEHQTILKDIEKLRRERLFMREEITATVEKSWLNKLSATESSNALRRQKNIIDDLRSRLHDAETEKDRFLANIDQLLDQLMTLEKKINDVLRPKDERIKELTHKFSELHGKDHGSRRELEHTLHNLSTYLRSRESEMSNLQRSLDETVLERTKLLVQKDSLEAQLAKVQGQLSVEHETSENSAKLSSEFKQMLEVTNTRCQKLEDIIRRMRLSLGHQRESLTAAATGNSTLEKLVNEMDIETKPEEHRKESSMLNTLFQRAISMSSHIIGLSPVPLASPPCDCEENKKRLRASQLQTERLQRQNKNLEEELEVVRKRLKQQTCERASLDDWRDETDLFQQRTGVIEKHHRDIREKIRELRDEKTAPTDTPRLLVTPAESQHSTHSRSSSVRSKSSECYSVKRHNTTNIYSRNVSPLLSMRGTGTRDPSPSNAPTPYPTDLVYRRSRESSYSRLSTMNSGPQSRGNSPSRLSVISDTENLSTAEDRNEATSRRVVENGPSSIGKQGSPGPSGESVTETESLHLSKRRRITENPVEE